MAENQVPISFSGNWEAPAISGGPCRYQLLITGTITINLISVPSPGERTSVSMGGEASGLNRSGNRGGAGQVAIKQQVTERISGQIGGAVNRLPELIEAGNARTFRQRAMDIFTGSLSYARPGSYTEFQVTLPSGDDLAHAYLLRFGFAVDGRGMANALAGRTDPDGPSWGRLTGSLTVQVRVGLSAQGAISIGALLLRCLPGALGATAAESVAAATAAGSATESSTVALSVGGTAAIAIPVSLMIMDGLNAVLASARHRGEQWGRCQMVAKGYLSRIYFEEEPQRWRNSNRVFQQGVRAAAAAIAANSHGSAGLFQRIYRITAVYSWQIFRHDSETDTTRFVPGSGEDRFNEAVRRFGEYLFSQIQH